MKRRIFYVYGVLKEAMRRFVDDDHKVYAGHMAFTMLLSLGPFLVSMILLAKEFNPCAAPDLLAMVRQASDANLIPGPTAEMLLRVIESVAPPPSYDPAALIAALGASAAQMSPVDQCHAAVQHSLIDQPSFFSTRSWLAWISAGVGLYAGSSAFEAARAGFNEAYDVKDQLNVLIKRVQSHFLALIIAILFLMISLGFVAVSIGIGVFEVGKMRELGEQYLGVQDISLLTLALPAMLGAFMFWLLLLGIHLTLPHGYVKGWSLYVWAQDEIDDRRAVRVPVRPGVWFSTITWFTFAVGFSVIMSFVSLDERHGALAGVVATLLFFFLSASTVFFGAQINIAIATIDNWGKPKWPHPSIPREPGFDENTQAAYRVLMRQEKPRTKLGRAVDFCRGGWLIGKNQADGKSARAQMLAAAEKAKAAAEEEDVSEAAELAAEAATEATHGADALAEAAAKKTEA